MICFSLCKLKQTHPPFARPETFFRTAAPHKYVTLHQLQQIIFNVFVCMYGSVHVYMLYTARNINQLTYPIHAIARQFI